MKNAIKNYFEELIKTDNAIAEVYDEKKLEGCMGYIMKQAKKTIKGNSGYVADEVVYKWARDYMLGDTDEPVKSEVQKNETVSAETETTADNGTMETDEDMEVQPDLAASTVESGIGSDEPIDVSAVMEAEKDFVEITSGELHRTHSDCGCYHEGHCMNKGSIPVEPNGRACSDFARLATNSDVQKLKIEKVETEPKVEKKKTDDDDNFLFDFMYE